jgi:molybdenum cofactor cytidylyltransferase
MKLTAALRLRLDPAAPDVVALVGGGGKSSTLFRLAGEIAAQGQRVVTTTTTHIGLEQLQAAPVVVEVLDEQPPWARLAEALAQHNHCLLVGPVVGERCIGPPLAVLVALQERAQELGLAALVVEADGSRRLPVKAPAAHEPVIPPGVTLVVSLVGLDALGWQINGSTVHRPEEVRALLEMAPGEEARLAPVHLATLLAHSLGGRKHVPEGARWVALLNKGETTALRIGGRLVAGLLAQRGLSALIGATGNPAYEPILERWGPMAAVVLAAGLSRRMGEAKQLVKVQGEAMVVRAARTALAGGVEQVVVVTGAYAGEVEAVLAPLQAEAGSRLRVVHNPAYADGQATSMQEGLAALALGHSGAVLLMPVDQPYLEPLLLRRMVWAWRYGADIVTPEAVGEMRGAPALFDARLWPALAKITGDTGGRSVLQAHRQEVVTVAADAVWLQDIDTPEQLP